ncbi:MAG: hypothetical protein N2234_07450, partial [Planctomycetota bacterium]|nr:hypothetical protein [Planctomycetota bacterium]
MGKYGLLVLFALFGCLLWAQEEPPAEPPQPEQPPQPEPPPQPIEPKKEEGKEGPFFIVKAGQQVRYEAIFEFIKQITGKEIIVSRNIMIMPDNQRIIKFATSFKATYPVLRAVLEVNGMV